MYKIKIETSKSQTFFWDYFFLITFVLYEKKRKERADNEWKSLNVIRKWEKNMDETPYLSFLRKKKVYEAILASGIRDLSILESKLQAQDLICDFLLREPNLKWTFIIEFSIFV